MSHFSFEDDNNFEKMTYYVHQMLEANILASNRFYANYSHEDHHIDLYRSITEKVFSDIKLHSKGNELLRRIEGKPMKPGFHRFN